MARNKRYHGWSTSTYSSLMNKCCELGLPGIFHHGAERQPNAILVDYSTLHRPLSTDDPVMPPHLGGYGAAQHEKLEPIQSKVALHHNRLGSTNEQQLFCLWLTCRSKPPNHPSPDPRVPPPTKQHRRRGKRAGRQPRQGKAKSGQRGRWQNSWRRRPGGGGGRAEATARGRGGGGGRIVEKGKTAAQAEAVAPVRGGGVRGGNGRGGDGEPVVQLVEIVCFVVLRTRLPPVCGLFAFRLCVRSGGAGCVPILHFPVSASLQGVLWLKTFALNYWAMNSVT